MTSYLQRVWLRKQAPPLVLFSPSRSSVAEAQPWGRGVMGGQGLGGEGADPSTRCQAQATWPQQATDAPERTKLFACLVVFLPFLENVKPRIAV